MHSTVHLLTAVTVAVLTQISDSDIEGTENTTVAKLYLHRHSVSSEDLYMNPMLPNKRFRTSTPDSIERQPEKEPIRCPLKEIVNHRPVLQIPPVDIVAAQGVKLPMRKEVCRD